MHIYSSQQIKEIDQDATEKGMSLFSLMENAGSGLFREIYPLLQKSNTILILSGKGNNGGDGIVLARYLKNYGFQAELAFPLGMPQTKTAQEHLDYYLSCGYKISEFSQDCQADWVIDALLGVGSTLPLRPGAAQLTKWMNEQKGKTISIDVPTGVSSDDGNIDEHCVVADYTFCLHGYKPSAFLFPSSDYYGVTSAVDIGLAQTSSWRVLKEEDVRGAWPKRTGNTHKGTFGTALLLAGSDEMPGSAALAAIGALRFGTGKLAIATSRHAAAIIGTFVPEATFLYNFHSSEMTAGYSCIGIGPGLLPNTELEKQISTILNYSVPVVLDAGALSNRTYMKRDDATILTPHPGEFSRMIGKSTRDIQRNRILYASQYAKENHVTVVLKGKYTVIAFPDGSGLINPTGNRALSKGGTGDTLTGMLTASIGTCKNIKDAVANAVYIHGLCADEWLKTNGEQTMLAHDFNQLLPKITAALAQ